MVILYICQISPAGLRLRTVRATAYLQALEGRSVLGRGDPDCFRQVVQEFSQISYRLHSSSSGLPYFVR